MFEATLGNRSQPELGTLTVTFPIPEADYEKTICELKKLQIGDAVAKDCFIEDIAASRCPALYRLIESSVNLDELDWLGKKLESFDQYELLQFSAAAERFGLYSADEMIDLSFCAGEMTVISDFSDLEKVGRKHYLTVHGAADMEELAKLNGKKLAQALITGQPGTVTQFGVVYDNGVQMEPVYNRKQLPQNWIAETCIMEVEIGTKGAEAANVHEWVQLPVSRIKLERAMLRAGIPSCGEMQMWLTDTKLPDEAVCALDVSRESLFELNRLSQACADFSEDDFEKFGAVCQLAKPACAANLCQLAENLDQFDFAPDVHTPEEYGRYMIQRSGHYEYDENLDEFYNYGDYGVQRMLQEDGVFTDRGYVAYNGTLTLEELMRDDPAESCRQEQETHTEGMAW